MLTWYCWKCPQGGGHGNHWGKRWHTRAHNSHQSGRSHSHSSRTLRHNENTTKKGATAWSIADIHRHTAQQEATHNDGEQLVWLLWTVRQMDVLTDTEMPDRCTDVPKRLQDIWGVQMPPQSPSDIWGTYSTGETYRCTGGMGAYGHMGAYRCTEGIQIREAYRHPLCCMVTTPHACL